MHCSCQYNYFESRIYRKAVCSMIPRTLVAASSRPLVLSILSQKDSYGYEIIQHVKQMTGRSMDWKDGMLYSVLQRRRLARRNKDSHINVDEMEGHLRDAMNALMGSVHVGTISLQKAGRDYGDENELRRECLKANWESIAA